MRLPKHVLPWGNGPRPPRRGAVHGSVTQKNVGCQYGFCRKVWYLGQNGKTDRNYFKNLQCQKLTKNKLCDRTQYINTTYRRTGTLWDSRYKASLIQAQTYLLSCQRYIELNPVRAAMVDDPAHYRWTSYRHNALGQASPYLTPHPL